jgi:FMN-dependent NADH-azoreductase
MQIGLPGSSNELMAHAIEYLKKHFRFVGIFTIVILVVYLVAVIGVVIAFAIR